MSASDQLRNLHAAMYPAPWKRSSRLPFDDHDILAEDGSVITEHAGDDAEPISLLRNALPLIADAIAAAETKPNRYKADRVMRDWHDELDRALAALADALKEAK